MKTKQKKLQAHIAAKQEAEAKRQAKIKEKQEKQAEQEKI